MYNVEVYGSLPPETAEKQEGYKETTLTWLSPGCMVMSNRDIPVTQEVELAIKGLLRAEHHRKVRAALDSYAKENRPRHGSV
jgi:hypothetical protein